MDTISAPSEEEELPVVDVFTDGFVVVKWGDGGANQTSGGLTSSYSNAPYSFKVLDSNGVEPLIKTFGTLLSCDGGILTIAEKRYRIRAQQPQQPQLDAGTKEVVEYVRKQLREAETLILSRVKSDAYREVTDHLGLKLSAAKWKNRPTDLPDIGVFTWFESEEDGPENREGYMNYLGEKIQWPEGYAITDCNEYKELLSVPKLGSGKHKMSGNIDVVLADMDEVENFTIRQNIRAGIELKKDTDAGAYEHQIVLQHLAASSLNPNESVLTVMTDLNKRWHFYWFGTQGGRLYRCVARTRSEAKFLLENMFHSSDSADATLFPTNFLDRATWRVFCGSNLSDKKDDSKETGAHGEQIAGNTYGMDVANELDLLDFVDEEEKRAIQLRFLSDHVLPMMTYVPEQKSHGTQEKESHELSAANLAFHNATSKLH
ncbi:MAG: hypothetical protein SGILL_007918 [Bacillariaceae sp.]